MNESFSLRGGKLEVLDRLSWETAAEFRAACEDLVRLGSAAPEIDLRLAGPITTPHMGVIVDAAERCSYYGRPLTLTVGPQQLRVLQAVGLGKLGRLRMDPEAEEFSAGAET